MYLFKRPVEKTPLEKTIEAVHVEMSTYTPGSEKYSAAADQLVKLYAIKDSSRRRVSPDTMAIVGGNLLGIIVIVGHERAHVVTSKALSFVMKAVK